MLEGKRLSREERDQAEDRRKGTTYCWCACCERLIAAYSEAGKMVHHRIDTAWRGDPLENPFPANTPCPGSAQYGEIIEGEIYQSPSGMRRWVRVQ